MSFRNHWELCRRQEEVWTQDCSTAPHRRTWVSHHVLRLHGWPLDAHSQHLPALVEFGPRSKFAKFLRLLPLALLAFSLSGKLASVSQSVFWASLSSLNLSSVQVLLQNSFEANHRSLSSLTRASFSCSSGLQTNFSIIDVNEIFAKTLDFPEALSDEPAERTPAKATPPSRGVRLQQPLSWS